MIGWRRTAWSGRTAVTRLLSVGVLAGFVLATYVVVVLGGGAVLGRAADAPSLALSVLATAVVALTLSPVQRRAEEWSGRIVRGSAATPYDVLSRFSETVTGAYSTDEIPLRMARLLAEGTRAEWAQVWLAVQDRLTLAATWPPDAAGDLVAPDAVSGVAAGRRTATVRHGGQLLGVLRLRERADGPLTPVEERLLAGLAAQAGLVLRLVALRAELVARHEELQTRTAQLTASRDQLIEAQDAERRRLERDIHDGAQQHLVALAVNLRLAETVAARSPERAAGILAAQADAAHVALDTVSQLSRGIYPPLLADEGLVPALRAAVATSPVPVSVQADGEGRLAPSVEAALYFCAMEAVQNAAKHANARAVSVRVDAGREAWRLTVVDDGVGFDVAPPRSSQSASTTAGASVGAGLANMRNRLEAVGGALVLQSRPGLGTTVTAEVPAETVAETVADAPRSLAAPSARSTA